MDPDNPWNGGFGTWVRTYRDEFPCDDNDEFYSAADQQSIIDDIMTFAALNAPICQSTGRPMVPALIDAFYDILGSTDFVGARITYYAQCGLPPVDS